MGPSGLDRNDETATEAEYETIGAEIVAETVREQMRVKISSLRRRMKRMFVVPTETQRSPDQGQSS